MTGDGYACGYRAAARLRDMEFVQFTPAGLVHPESLHGLSINHELLAHPGVRVLDGRRELVCVPGKGTAHDLAFRLELIRLFHREIQSGRATPHGGLYLDLCEVTAEEVSRLSPALWGALVAQGIDPSLEVLELAPEVHFFMGGLQADEMGETSLPGLFAVGEAAGGCHGANRLTHNAFPEVIVFAPRAGKAAGERSLRMAGRKSPEPAPLAEWGWPEAPDIRRELQAMMLAAAGPTRSAEGLASGMAKLQELRSAASGKPIGDPEDLLAGLATRNLIQVAELVLHSALTREESRGSQFREDHPARNDARWLVNLVVERGPEGPRIREKPTDLSYLEPGVS
jgi:succinate dehydrogenase/fumarate reductase flavoprotein subunit